MTRLAEVAIRHGRGRSVANDVALADLADVIYIAGGSRVTDGLEIVSLRRPRVIRRRLVAQFHLTTRITGSPALSVSRIE
jgi:hypothetical protein